MHKLLWWEWPLLLAGLAIWLAQLWIASPGKSAAFDEQYHLTAGYSYLRTGDVRLATTHPPLMGMLAALPLLGRDNLVLPLDHPAWQTGDRFLFSDIFLWEANADSQGILVAARRPLMLVGALLVLGLFAWARRLIGVRASWPLLALVILDPNLLGNARVITTDLGLTCFLLLAIWRFWCWLEGRTWVNLFWAGLAAGLALGAKYTGLFFWPSALVILLLYPAKAEGDRWWRRMVGLAGMGMVALAVLWAIYGFAFDRMVNVPFPLPLPAPFYWQQLYNTFFRIVNLQGDRYDFFWGEAANHGWWAYFPGALAVKTPLPLLLLALGGLVTALRQDGWRRSSVLWVLPALFLLLGLTGVLSIGYRHILPIVPFLLLLAGVALARLGAATHHRWLANMITIALVAWSLWGALRIFPHQEAFFNELAGDWYHWSDLLVDSNLDWGQDLPALRQRMDELGIDEVNLAYFGKALPERYGVRYRPLYSYLRFVDGVELNAYNPYTPEPGWYAISATSLRLGLHQTETLDLYVYFRDRRPNARAGYSIYLYHLVDPPNLPVDRRVVVGEPVYRLAPSTLDIQKGHRIQVTWVQTPETIIYPLGAGFTPPTAGYQVVEANFQDVLTLLGYTPAMAQVQPGQPLLLTFYWQVGPKRMETPAPTQGASLSAFVHVTVPGNPGQKVAQFDGWPTALRGLEPGDVIGQVVQLDFGGGTALGFYELLVGLYSPQSFARLLVSNRDGAPDFVHTGEIQVIEAP
jgi:4-amino-4-deoxy-L-arabinose transferase-like glycosyltransferase